jgi:subtilisin family serine protease
MNGAFTSARPTPTSTRRKLGGADRRPVIVATIDSGIDHTHPDLARNYIGGFDFANGDSDPMDDHGHGTHVAGIIAAALNNPTGNPAEEEGVVAWRPTQSSSRYKVSSANGDCSDAAIARQLRRPSPDGARDQHEPRRSRVFAGARRSGPGCVERGPS